MAGTTVQTHVARARLRALPPASRNVGSSPGCSSSDKASVGVLALDLRAEPFGAELDRLPPERLVRVELVALAPAAGRRTASSEERGDSREPGLVGREDPVPGDHSCR